MLFIASSLVWQKSPSFYSWRQEKKLKHLLKLQPINYVLWIVMPRIGNNRGNSQFTEERPSTMTFLDFLRAYWLPILLILIVLYAVIYVYKNRTQLFRRE